MNGQKKPAAAPGRDLRRHQTLKPRRSLRTLSRPAVALATELESLNNALEGALETLDVKEDETKIEEDEKGKSDGQEEAAPREEDAIVMPTQDAIFFQRVEARRRTLKTAQVIRDLGIRTHTIDRLTQDEGDHWSVPPLETEGAANRTDSKKSIHFGQAQSEESSTMGDAESLSDADEPSGRGERRRLEKTQLIWERAKFLHENRSAHVKCLYRDFAETRRELQKIQGRMESKVLGLFRVLREQSEFCSFLRKGLEQQSKLQLANVANKGWFRTGHGGIVDLRKVMKPFLDARDALDEREEAAAKEEEEVEAVDAKAWPKCCGMANARPFGLPQAPIPLGGATERLIPDYLRTKLRVGHAVEGAEMRQKSEDIEAMKRMRRVGILRARLQKLRQEDQEEDSPLQLALIKSELYELTADESILEVSDWQQLFPAVDTSELGGIFHDKATRNLKAPKDITRYAAENNRRFTHIYFKGSLEDELSDEEIRSERHTRISSMLKEQVDTLRDAEEEIKNTFIRARRNLPKVIHWLPPRFRDMVVSEKELLRDIRQRYYRDAARRKRLLRALPDGLSACALDPPPPPRQAQQSDWTEMLVPPTETAPTQQTARGPEGVKSFLPTRTFDSEVQSSLDGSDLLYAKDQFDFSAMSDQEFTQAFLSVLDIKASTLLTGNANGGAPPEEALSSTNRERLQQLMPPPNTIKMFGCKSPSGYQAERLKGPISSMFDIVPDPPPHADQHLLLDVEKTDPPLHEYYRLDRVRQQWVPDALL